MKKLFMAVWSVVKAPIVRAAQVIRESVSPKVLALGTGLGAGSMAMAQTTGYTLDTTAVVSTITNGVTALSSIGVAVLSLVVVIKLFKWAQRTL